MSDQKRYPTKIVQFGEGNFLRAFIDWMVEGMNARAGFGGSVTIAKTIPGPFASAFARQNYDYHLVIRGKDGDKIVRDRLRIGCISGTVNGYEDFDEYLKAATNPDLRVIVSNTTEAGIAWSESDRAGDRPAPSYPGKLTQFLRARFLALKGTASAALIVLPCELIEKNGQTLKGYVLRHAERWYGDPAFSAWLDRDCTFLDSLVDRIVPGHDAEERKRCLAETGFDDELIVVTEPYHIFILQGKEREDVLPLRKAGFNVVWTDDLTPWRTMKVRILNGGHTFMAMIGLGLGIATVRECLEHPLLGKALDRFYADDVLPLMPFSDAELKAYHAVILDRFRNPFVDHKIKDIALNSMSKWINRILPGMRDYVAKYGKAPRFACFGLAALFYRYFTESEIQDDKPVLAAFRALAARFNDDPAEAARSVFGEPAIWIQNAVVPTEVAAETIMLYAAIRANGLAAALKKIL